MATNIPPHNLSEVIDACQALLKNPQLTIDELIEIVPAPDFPTRGVIYGVAGVREGYRTGRGRIVMRARTHFEEADKGGRMSIVIDELPYQVNKANLLMRIGELVREKRLDGISDIRDESDRSGMRAVIELKRGEVSGNHLNRLWKETQLPDTFGLNWSRWSRPPRLSISSVPRSVPSPSPQVSREHCFERQGARAGHVLAVLAVPLSNAIMNRALQAAASPSEAKAQLMALFWRSALGEEVAAAASAIAA